MSAAQSKPSVAGKTVVIADDDPTIVEYLELRCRHLGLKVETAYDGLKAVLKVGKARPQLLVLDLNLPDVEGFRVMERLADPKFPKVPVIVLTSRSDDAAIKRCKDLNAYYVHKDGETWDNLEPLIFELLCAKPAESKPEPPQQPAATPRILLVDDDVERLRTLTQGLQKYPVEVIHASSGMQGFLTALRCLPDLIVTDYDMEHGGGNYLLARIKSTRSTRHIPVVVYSGTPLERGLEHAINRDLVGRGQAATFIPRPLDPARLLAEIRKYVALPVPA
ncbi:response regulator [Methyloceanibacter sp.]|uniref:response regulator n=1 Tax=Methyloceanibacter sp. TaxID=1965321 RepID=UPI002D416FEA|nr:response regulator [Methyloceanibacter sp.]HZP09526.1 response regulator [Methyloceanibacter sp.]